MCWRVKLPSLIGSHDATAISRKISRPLRFSIGYARHEHGKSNVLRGLYVSYDPPRGCLEVADCSCRTLRFDLEYYC